jgi:hypothetical protein
MWTASGPVRCASPAAQLPPARSIKCPGSLGFHSASFFATTAISSPLLETVIDGNARDQDLRSVPAVRVDLLQLGVCLFEHSQLDVATRRENVLKIGLL